MIAQQRAELQRQIWQMAHEIRGAVDGWDFKQYVLGILFYRFMSENFSEYVQGYKGYKEGEKNYEDYTDEEISDDIKDDLINAKGYFIYPSELFQNVIKTADKDDNLNIKLDEIFKKIENSAKGDSEEKVKGLFADFDITSSRMGNTVKEKNTKLANLMKCIGELNFGEFNNHQIDLFGDAYEFLISNYAANAGKSGGEFFTPQCVSRLIAKIAIRGLEEAQQITVYDPACGSGSLLLQVKKQLPKTNKNYMYFYGQELNATTYNLARMNMFLHDVNYNNFNIALGDTLTDSKHLYNNPMDEFFDIVVSNPPYSVKWVGSKDETLNDDPRFTPAPFAPASKGDLAFVMDAVYHLSARGRAAIVCFPGIFYRSGPEEKIRQHLVNKNYVEAVINLAPNLFYGTSIATTILVLSKKKGNDTKVHFIDASGLFIKLTNNNGLSYEGEGNNVDTIMETLNSRKETENFSILVDIEDIKNHNYNLSVNAYLENKQQQEEDEEEIDIITLNDEIKDNSNIISELMQEIEELIAA